VQVDPIKPLLKAPGTKRLKLKHGEQLSNFAFKFNLRRYSPVQQQRAAESAVALALLTGPGRAVQVDPIKPTLKAPGSKRLKLQHEKLLSNFSFNFDLRRYTSAAPPTPSSPPPWKPRRGAVA